MFRICFRSTRLALLALLLTPMFAEAASQEMLPAIELDFGSNLVPDDLLAKQRQEPLKGLNDLQLDVYCRTVRPGFSSIDNPLLSTEIADTVANKLRAAGLNVHIRKQNDSADFPRLVLGSSTLPSSHNTSYSARLMDKVTLPRQSGRIYQTTIWRKQLETPGIAFVEDIKDELGQLSDKLLNDYLGANPVHRHK